MGTNSTGAHNLVYKVENLGPSPAQADIAAIPAVPEELNERRKTWFWGGGSNYKGREFAGFTAYFLFFVMYGSIMSRRRLDMMVTQSGYCGDCLRARAIYRGKTSTGDGTRADGRTRERVQLRTNNARAADGGVKTVRSGEKKRTIGRRGTYGHVCMSNAQTVCEPCGGSLDQTVANTRIIKSHDGRQTRRSPQVKREKK